MPGRIFASRWRAATHRSASNQRSTPVSQTIDELLSQLEQDIPQLRTDMNTFHSAFEERACQIFALEDNDRVHHRLMQMLRDAGLE